jgi:hypothetical protein
LVDSTVVSVPVTVWPLMTPAAETEPEKVPKLSRIAIA